MIKLSDLLEAQENMMHPYDDTSTHYSKIKGSIEQESFDVAHPENKERTVGWTFNDEFSDAMTGREFQTMEDLRKLTNRLIELGYEKSKVISWIQSYLNSPE